MTSSKGNKSEAGGDGSAQSGFFKIDGRVVGCAFPRIESLNSEFKLAVHGSAPLMIAHDQFIEVQNASSEV